MLKHERAQESKRDRGKRLKLERIEAAARRLFAETGYEATTTREIADAAGIGVGTLFVYFPEKLDLLVYLYQRDLARILEQSFDALPADVSIVDGCARVFDALYDFYAADTTLARTFVKELMFLKPERQQDMLDTTWRFSLRLGELVAAAQARGEANRDIAPPLAAHQLFGIYYWGLVAWLAGAGVDRRGLSMLVRMSLDALMQGLAPRSGAAVAGGCDGAA